MHINTKYTWLFAIAFVFFMFYQPIFCLLLVGTLMVVYALHYSLFLYNINKYGKEIEGKMKAHKTEEEDYKTPLVEFEINGTQILKKPYYYTSTDLSKFKTYKSKIDKPIPIVYLPNNPEKFIIKRDKGLIYLSLIFLCIIGLAFILICLAQLFHVINIPGMD